MKKYNKMSNIKLTSISFNGIPKAAPAGLTCLKDVADGRPVTSLSSLTNCQLFKASHKLMYPGDPLITKILITHQLLIYIVKH